MFSLGDPVEFTVALEPRDDGWVWAAPEWARYWLSPPSFEVFEGGEWRGAVPEQVRTRSGSALFSRCLTGSVRASGECRPLSWVCEVDGWRVVVETSTESGNVLGGDTVVRTKVQSATAYLEVSVDCPPPVYVCCLTATVSWLVLVTVSDQPLFSTTKEFRMNPVETPLAAKTEIMEPPVKSRFLSREDLLGAANHLKEEEKKIEGLGTLLLSEITGDVRAELIGQQATGMMADTKKFDRKGYERTLIQAGVLDPTSAPGARTTLFRLGDMDRVMKIGGAKIADIVDVIERLSSLGQYSGAAEGNSETTPSDAGTS